MEEENTNTAVATETTADDSQVFSEDIINQLKSFVAQRMFEGVSFTQVLSTIDLQCRQQASKRVDEAPQEDLQAIFDDMQSSLAEAYETQEAQITAAQAEVNAAAASQDITAAGTEECCGKPESCDTPDKCPEQ